MAGLADVIQVVGWNGQHRAQGEIVDPLLVERVELGQVVIADLALVSAVPQGNAVLQGIHRRPQVNNQVRGRQKFAQGVVEGIVGS